MPLVGADSRPRFVKGEALLVTGGDDFFEVGGGEGDAGIAATVE
jgi:hypothetical protein